MGQKPRDARHVYANPLQPEICPVLALALYWITIPISTSEDKESLFPGNSQDSRYRGILGTLLTEPDGAKVVKDAGLTATQIGCHSTRKGSSTYASSGSTACPPSTAISIRASWTLGGVEGHYLRYEAAGDQYVGRTVTGLPIQSANFAILPPFFKCSVTDEISEAIKVAFPNLPLSCNRVGEFALASLVFHRNWLHSTLPASLTLHPIFSSRVLDKLASLVECRLWKAGDSISPTGVPPHISIITAFENLKTQVAAQADTIQSLVLRIGDEFICILDQREIHTNTVTVADVNSIMTSAIEKLQIPLLVQRLDQFISEGGAAVPATNSPAVTSKMYTVHTWGG